MKNILLLSNVYPAPDIPKGYTPVVHYFAREWMKMGYNVRVINYDINFPSLYYKLSSPFNDRIASKVGYVVKNNCVNDMQFEMDKVCVRRIVMTKYFPHRKCGKKEIIKAYDKSINFLKGEQFVPDVIICHWANPCLQLMAMLKELYRVPTCFVAHGIEELKVYGNHAEELLKTVDLVGCRSDYIRKNFECIYGKTIPTFICYSGIPEKYVNSSLYKNINNISNFVYVGTLISRKFPASIITALSKSFGSEPFSMHYIGEGNEKTIIEKKAKECGVVDNVHIHGRLQRDQVVEILDKSDVFIMISKNEVFGLVYLEAMARGCITIASRREGFDGIIKDGVNGFLCEAGDSTELSSIINRIRTMSKEDIQRISDSAIQTACQFTDAKVARMYIDNVQQIISNKSK